MFSSFNAVKREIKGQVITQIFFFQIILQKSSQKIATGRSFKNLSTFL